MDQPRRLKFIRATCILALCAAASAPAFAVNKDMVQLQTQVQDLQDAVSHLQQSNDERMGVLKDLVQQTADSVNKMSVAVETLQTQMRTQAEGASGKIDQVSGQVQSLNDSLDEVKARISGLEKALQAVANQQQSINAALQNMAPPAGSAPTAAPAAPGMTPAPAGTNDQTAPPATTDNSSGGGFFPQNQGPYANAPNSAPPAPAPAPAIATSRLFSMALNDYVAAKWSLATSEFQQIIQTNPADPLAGTSYYYLGEIDYRAGRYADAVKEYDHVLTQYPGNPKIPVSHLHKAQALLQLKDREAGIAELRALILRFPNSPEATQARARLNGLGIRPAPRGE